VDGGSVSEFPGGHLPGVGTRHRRTITWELIACGFDGHCLVGTDAATVGVDDHPVVREMGEVRWHRCLRCDAWLPLPPPVTPTRSAPPPQEEIEVPARGKPLRDLYVLRIISVERGLHVIVLGLLAAAIFVFAGHHQQFHDAFTRILTDLQGTFGGTTGKHGLLADLNKLFALRASTLRWLGVAVAAYTVLLACEMVGLWLEKRWAEYLTLVETSVLIPYELYEIVGNPSPLKGLTLAFNLAIVVYLAFAHRLFGLRGGGRALAARKAASSGWPSVMAATPPRPS
jgi:uncharacterized membrane protein (DUF2068 family)